MTAAFQIGQRVKVVSVPTDLPNDELQTRKIFALCLGRVFAVVGVNGNLVELEVGEVVGGPAYAHSIWVEPEHLERAK